MPGRRWCSRRDSRTPQQIRRLVQAVEVPVNVIASASGPPIPELAALGVGRVSTGGSLARAAYGAIAAAAAELQGPGTLTYLGGVITWAEFGAAAGSIRRQTTEDQASARTSRSFAANASGSPVWPYSPPRKPPWSLGKRTGSVPSRSATASRAAVRQLALGLRAGGDDDPGRRRAQRVEVRLVVGARDDVLAEQRVGPVAVVLGRHPEHRRIGTGWCGELGVIGPGGSRRR